MIQQGVNIRSEFKEKVKKFCSLNECEWRDEVYESTTGGVVGKPRDVIKVLKYIHDLEVEYIENRKRKNFWWSFWN